jgi:dihydroxyacid dehydratase/phosphogluconate dehydratase
MDARSANGTFLYSTMTPYSANCGLFSIQGNVCNGGVVRMGNAQAGSRGFDRKLYLAISYLGVHEMLADFYAPENLVDRLRRKVDRDDLYRTWQFNQRDASAEAATWNKNQLWDYLISNSELRIMVVVAGVGPRAAGMPEVQVRFPSVPVLESMSVIVTDGRVPFQHEGISISHVVPEAYDGGALAAVRTGDWIYLDLVNRQLQVVSRARNSDGFKPLSVRELRGRPETRKRVREVARRREELLPSFRVLMDHVSPADSGVCPTSN